MVVGIHRNAKAVIDLDAIKHNIEIEKKRMRDDQKLFAVVKANAYGHGMIEVARTAKEAGANGFCVAIIDEGIELRNAGFDDLVLILGVCPAEQSNVIAANDLSVAVGDLDFLENANPLLKAQGLKLKVHLAFDTGMGRIGFVNGEKVHEAEAFMKENSDQFEFEGIFTHFACADTKDDSYYKKQLEKFNELKDALDDLPPYVHVANSAASMWHDDCGGNAVRYGITMYGLNPSGRELELPCEIKPAFTLESELVSVRLLEPGTGIGYGKTYTVDEPQWIGTVPLGYADGWLRRMQGFKVLINGEYCQSVGRVCMDQFMVRLPYEMEKGTKVTLIGENGGKRITAQDVADYADTIHYEILCSVSERVPREFIKKY